MPTTHAARTWVIAVSAAVAVAAGLVAVVLSDGADEEAAPPAAATTSTSAGPTTTVTTTAVVTTLLPTTSIPASAGVPAPEVLVVATFDGRLRVTRAGRTATVGIPGGRAARVALAPDGRSAVVERWTDGPAPDLQQWDVAAFPPFPVGEPLARQAAFPAFSPDGRRLAYAQGDDVRSALVVRDLAAATERRWTFDGELSQLSWAPDGRRIVMETERGGEGRQVVFDSDRPEGPVADVAALGGGPFHRAAFRGSLGTLVAVEPVAGQPPSGRVVEADPATGAVLRVLATVPFEIGAVRSDASGRHLLVVGAPSSSPAAPGSRPGLLYRWGEDGLTRLDEGIADADW